MEPKPKYNNQMSQLTPNPQQEYSQYPQQMSQLTPDPQQEYLQYPQQQIPQYPQPYPQQQIPQYPMPQYPQQQIPQYPQYPMPQYPQQQIPQYPQQQMPQYPQQELDQQAPPAVSEVDQKEEKGSVIKTKYPQGIRPPPDAVQVNPYPIIPVQMGIPTVPIVGAIPVCLTCGGRGYYMGRRCICRGGTAAQLRNATLLHMGLMYGSGFY